MFDHSQDEFLHYRHLFAKDHMGMHDINQDQPLNPGTTNISEFSMLAQDKKDVKPAEAKKQPAKTEINKLNAKETEK